MTNNLRCEICKKKLSKLMIQLHTCKCKGIYCTEHKYIHNCSYDFKTNGNTVVKIIANKIDKI